MKDFLTIDDYDFKGKTVLLRVDINSPVSEKGKVEISDRSIAAAKTIRELAIKKAKVVVLAHQGRKGDPDFIPLKQHARILTRYSRKKVKFVNDIAGEKAVKKIKSLKNGQIILLNNVRLLPDETEKKSAEQHTQSELVRVLAPLADVFVNDAFSAAHRSQASTIGFIPLLPSLVGRTMEMEVGSIEKVFGRMKISKHDIFVLGGAKPDEPLEIMECMLGKGTLETVLVDGVIGLLFLVANGYDLGDPTVDFLKEKGYIEYLPQVKKILKKYKKKVVIPLDVAVEVNKKRKEFSVEELPVNYQIMDIGTKTIEKYIRIIKQSKNIVMKGPAGVYEKKGFGIGTKIILKAVKNSGSVSLVGGGHTLSAISKFKISKNGFSHVSLGGGALIIYLSGKKLPALEALRKN
ncbi:MAG: phosphoglycerate kinase [Candidatus Aenigmarchaeota archaeon]|nr:phosphoglycerate kinase [Candidatus Aenigmarchaeota archaeon]